ncbi:MAG: hypothetical protein ABJA34_13080 [Pseudonocardiales bacterium]
MSRRISRRWAWLTVAAAGLMMAWLAAPVTAPLYDGVGFPDEPYRYVTRPAGDTKVTAPPSSVSVRMPVVDGTTDGFNAASREQGPQVSVFVPTGALVAPKDAHSILLQAVPLAPAGPADAGPVEGNVYRLSATADVGKPSLALVKNKIQIVMRATTARQPDPVMEYRAAGGKAWTRLSTARYGTDVYAASVRGFGDYALVFARAPVGVSTSARSAGLGKYAYALILGGLLLLLGSIVLGIRLVRARAAAAAADFEDDDDSDLDT